MMFSNFSTIGHIDFEDVRNAYKYQNRFYNPLLDGPDKIEQVLIETGYLGNIHHLGSYDCDRERFPIIVYLDADVPLTKIESFRMKLAKWIRP